MNARSKILHQANFLALLNATSSPASAPGPTPLERPAGPTRAPSGPVLAHANLSARRAKERALLTSGTFGRPGFGSSSSNDLSLSLASKLAAKTAWLGSILWRLTWKESATPSGRPLFRLVASERRTGANDFIGWPTPTKANGEGGQTMNHCSPTGRRPDGSKSNVTLNGIAQLTHWPTPTGTNAESAPYRLGRHGKKILQLTGAAQLMDFGKTPIGSIAGTENIGRLNPAFCRWLMGLPDAWDKCAHMATRLLSTKPKPLSKAT